MLQTDVRCLECEGIRIFHLEAGKRENERGGEARKNRVREGPFLNNCV